MKDIFCKIANKKTPALVLFEDNEIVAFLDVEPATKGHSLIITKRHYETIFEVPENILCRVTKMAKIIGLAIQHSFSFDGISIFLFAGRTIQDIEHFHLHICGRNLKNEGHFGKTFKDEKDKAEKLSITCDTLKNEINSLLSKKYYNITLQNLKKP